MSFTKPPSDGDRMMDKKINTLVGIFLVTVGLTTREVRAEPVVYIGGRWHRNKQHIDEGNTGDQHLEKAWPRRAQRIFYQRRVAGQGDVVGRYHSHQWGYTRHAQHGRLGRLRLESYRRDDEPVGYLLCRAQAYR